MSEQNIEHQQRSQALIDAAKHFKEASEIFQREADRLHEEQESTDAMYKKFDQVHFKATVKLNVGGQHFTTSVQTLTKDPNSMLAAMLSGRFDMKWRTHFRFILNFLRTGKLTLPEGATCTKELEEEAEFYQIQGLIDALRSAKLTVKVRTPDEPFRESTILTNVEYRKILKGWLPEFLVGEWRLLFRVSRDGFAASAFHSKCDNKGPTITVVKSGANIFGGFTEKSWANYRGCKFLLQLIINHLGIENIPEWASWCFPCFIYHCPVRFCDDLPWLPWSRLAKTTNIATWFRRC